MMCCNVRSQWMGHTASHFEAGSFVRFFLNHAQMDTILLVSIFAILLGVSVLLSTRIILAVLVAALVILDVIIDAQAQPSPPSGGI